MERAFLFLAAFLKSGREQIERENPLFLSPCYLCGIPFCKPCRERTHQGWHRGIEQAGIAGNGAVHQKIRPNRDQQEQRSPRSGQDPVGFEEQRVAERLFAAVAVAGIICRQRDFRRAGRQSQRPEQQVGNADDGRLIGPQKRRQPECGNQNAADPVVNGQPEPEAEQRKNRAGRDPAAAPQTAFTGSSAHRMIHGSSRRLMLVFAAPVGAGVSAAGFCVPK